MPLPSHTAPLCWIHFGDLHMTDAAAQNYRDACALMDEVDANMREGVAFAVLPGDNADDGTAEQFRLVRAALDRLTLPHHILPGDHDRKPGHLEAFYKVLGGERLPLSHVVQGCRCVFLDIVSTGSGGPDFRLGSDQFDWVETELRTAEAHRQSSVVFMHAYPADLAHGTSDVAALSARYSVGVVDTGHTHYNELGNDGRTVYAATRSTGQIEEGPPGFSVAAVDDGQVSWRFKPLGGPWPLALITAPSDRRLVRKTSPRGRGASGSLEVRALGWSAAGIRTASCAVDGGPWQPMDRTGGGPAWRCSIDVSPGAHAIGVMVEDGAGRTGSDDIEIDDRAGDAVLPPPRGSDAHSIGAWPERHVFGTQLGPNRNGRKW